MSNENPIKCIAIGDGAVGKTTLLHRLAKSEIEEKYIPTIFDNQSMQVTVNEKTYDIHLIDTAGQEGYDVIRTQFYSEADVFLVCFSVTNTDSFSNVNQTWLPELELHNKNAEILLVGTKSDLRNDPETIDKMNISRELFVTKETANNFAKSRGLKYVECSAKTEANIEEVTNSIVQLATNSKKRTSTWWLSNPLIKLIKRTFCCPRHYS